MQAVVFRKQKSAYKRDTKTLQDYIKQAAHYLSKVKFISTEEATQFVKTNMRPGGLFEFKDPEVKFMHREDFQDRVLSITTMSRFLADVAANDESLSPTFTSYCSPNRMESLLALNTMNNIKGRDISKAQMFEAKDDGNMVRYVFKNLEQNNKKTTNNSLSGSSLSASTSLFNPTSHSSLTTNCRNTTAFGNANNEKFIEGNRHYMDVDTILNNLVSISVISDMEAVEYAVRKFGLAIPTADEVLDCVNYSRHLYFESNRLMPPVYKYIAAMSPMERVAFVYTGDYYHLYKHNREFATSLLNDLIYLPTEPLSEEETKIVMSTISDDTLNLARQHCHRFSKGRKVKDLKNEEPENYRILAATAKHINNRLVEIQPFIDAFWLSGNMPASGGNFPNSIRRSVLGGDTDSTLFTVQEWISRIYGKITFGDSQGATADTMIYLAAQTSSHLHAMMSANYGVHPDRMFDTQMKNEYAFRLFIPTLMAKHYWAAKTAQEGNVFKDLELELKGANMISSSTPGDIVKNVKRFLSDQMRAIMNNQDIYLDDLLDEISYKEKSIYNDVKTGKTDYFKMAHLKRAEAYKVKDENRTPYWNHLFWNRTFGKHYGIMEEPPYSMTKVSLEINNVTEFKTWLESINNPQLVKDIEEELALIGRKFITTAYVPNKIVQLSGIPDEILNASNARKMVRECCGSYYHILETMGVSMANKKNTRMVYDIY